MATVKKRAKVVHSAEKMYRLVDGIEQYPEFIPWCSKSQIIMRDENEVRASLTFKHGALQKKFSTLNRLHPPQMMEIRLLDGPFKQLEGFWRFQPTADGGCEIMLDLDFEFSSRLLALVFGPLFHQAANKLVDVFLARADDLYGKD